MLTRAHLPRLLVLCLAIWLHAANTMLAATTIPEAVGDIGGLRLISWAFALYLMGSIVAATAVSALVAGFVPPALLGNLLAWRFSALINAPRLVRSRSSRRSERPGMTGQGEAAPAHRATEEPD